MPLLPLHSPPALQAPAPASPDAEDALLEAFDWGRPLPPAPKLKGMAALDHRWLRAAATCDLARELPAQPYVAGPQRREAEALRHLLRTPRERIRPELEALPVRTSGTALALWRWGQAQVRAGAFEAGLRRLWEDRLLRSGPALTRGYALRHALCWALAEKDEARFAQVRYQADEDALDLQGFQRLFGLLGGPSVPLRLWTLPGLEYRDLRLDQLGARRVWICPAEAGSLPALPPDAAWIIPSDSGALDEREASLPPALHAEGQALADRLRAEGRSAYFAPSRGAFESLGLAWFPILVDLDARGDLQGIRMGDAAPARP